MGYFLLRNDALFVGPAAALNACAAVKVARKLGPGHNVVTILCDGGDRYISKVEAGRSNSFLLRVCSCFL